MLWDIVLTWWLGGFTGEGVTVIHERFGAFESEAKCKLYLAGEFYVADDERWGPEGFRAVLGDCYPQEVARELFAEREREHPSHTRDRRFDAKSSFPPG